MSTEVEAGESTVPLAAEDAGALTRLMRRSLGRGFRLVVIEVALPRNRRRILEWLRTEVAPLHGAVVEVGVEALAGENLWAELGEHLDASGGERERVVLALHGFQEAAHGQPDERAGLYRQLNVQRDLFVRDLGCFWVLLIHPYGSRKLQDIAPDFCDFVSLWVRAPQEMDVIELPRGDARRGAVQVGHPFADEPKAPRSALLRAASAATDAGLFEQARDLLTRFDLAEGAADEDEGRALLLRSRLELLRGNLDAARLAAEQALGWSTARGDTGELETADALHSLAGVLEATGEYGQARALIERALAIKLAHYREPGHPSVAASLHELARVLRAMGDIRQSRQLLERVLAMVTAGPGPNSIAAAIVLHELASVLRMQGDDQGARRALERTLEIEVQEFATELHPSVAKTYLALAQVLHGQGDLDGARHCVARSLEIAAKVYGTEFHPDVMASRHELAVILHHRGDLDGARHQFERVLEIEQQVYGTKLHPSAAATLHDLASVLLDQGDLDGAQHALERALEIWLAVYGTELHPNVATVLHSLALLFEARGNLDEAAATYERAIAIDAHVLGPNHHSTCLTEIALAKLLLETGDRDRARALLQHARPILARVLGPANAWTKKADALLDL